MLHIWASNSGEIVANAFLSKCRSINVGRWKCSDYLKSINRIDVAQHQVLSFSLRSSSVLSQQRRLLLDREPIIRVVLMGDAPMVFTYDVPIDVPAGGDVCLQLDDVLLAIQ
jgi:hypothetical protein